MGMRVKAAVCSVVWAGGLGATGVERVRCDKCVVVGPWELLVLRGGGELLAISVRERRGSKAQINYK